MRRYSPRAVMVLGQAWARLWRELETRGHVQDGVVLAQVHQLDPFLRAALAEALEAGARLGAGALGVDLAEAEAVDLAEGRGRAN